MSFIEKLRKLFKSSQESKTFDDSLETLQENKERWRSIYIVYFTMFLMSLGFSIVMTGIWPYLDKMDSTAGKEFMGLIIAANPLGQLIFSPIFGWWSNKLGSIRSPLISSLILFTFTSAIYSCLELFDSHVKHLMLWSRLLVGISSANVAVCRSYLSAATKYSERTKAVSMISLAQVLGFMVGPAIQAAVVPLGDKGVWLIPNKLKLNMYTAPGWINVFLTIINIYLFFPNVFHERKIAAREVMVKEGKESEKATWKGVKPDYFAAWTYIIMFFVIVFNFMLMETLGTPLIMDQLGWSKDDALFYMGVLLSVCALCSIVTFPLIPVLSRKFSEVKLLIWVGFFLVFIGRMLCIPFYGPTPLVYDVNLRLNLSRFCDQQMKNITLRDQLNYHQLNESLHKLGSYLDPDITNEMEVRQMTFDCGDDLLGCPSNQEWCNYVPAITFAQFILCFILTVIGYPIGVTLIQTLFSKLLGSRPQGVWMGLMTGAGCLSRIMGPVFVTYIYQTYGTIWTFGLTAIMMVVGLLWLLYFRRRLEPHDPYEGTQEMKDLVSINDGQKELLS